MGCYRKLEGTAGYTTIPVRADDSETGRALADAQSRGLVKVRHTEVGEDVLWLPEREAAR